MPCFKAVHAHLKLFGLQPQGGLLAGGAAIGCSMCFHMVCTYLSCVPRRSQLLLQGSGDLTGIKEKLIRELQRHPHIALAEDERCCGREVPEAAPSAVLSADAHLGVTKTSNKAADYRGLAC